MQIGKGKAFSSEEMIEIFHLLSIECVCKFLFEFVGTWPIWREARCFSLLRVIESFTSISTQIILLNTMLLNRQFIALSCDDCTRMGGITSDVSNISYTLSFQ